ARGGPGCVQAADGIRVFHVTGVQTCALPIWALDDSNGIAESRGSDYFVDILSEFIATGGVRTGVVGGAVSELFDARAMVDFGVEWMERNLGERKQPNLSYP